MGDIGLYKWYRQVQKKDLGETRVGWLQYFQNQAKDSKSILYDNQKLELEKNCDELKHGELPGDFKAKLQTNIYESPGVFKARQKSSIYSTPQHEKELSDSNFWEKFEEPVPSTPQRNTSALEESCSSSNYSATIPLADFFSPTNSIGSRNGDMVASLGANLDDSSVMWTSALATPSTAASAKKNQTSTPSTLERRTLHPQSGLRQKVMARTLFSPHTPGGQTSFSNEWSPNLGIIKCHSPVPEFGMKGMCATPKNNSQADFRVNQTQEFQVTGVNKLTQSRNLTLPDENSRKVSCVTNDNADITVKNSLVCVKTLSQVKQNLSPINLKDKNISTMYNICSMEMEVERDLCQYDNDKGCMATHSSEMTSENPFDIICSPVKKKAKVESEVVKQFRFEFRSTTDKRSKDGLECNANSWNDEADSELVSGNALVPISRKEYNEQQDSDKHDNKVLASPKCHAGLFKNAEVNLRTGASDGHSNDKSQKTGDPICRIEHVSHQNSSECNSEVCASKSCSTPSIKKDTNNCKSVTSDEKPQKTFDCASSVIPKAVKLKSTCSKLSLLGTKKLNAFRYPSKSDDSYEKLGLTFKKTLTNENPAFYQNDADCIIKSVKADAVQTKVNHMQKSLRNDIKKESFDCPKSCDMTENLCVSTLKTVVNETSHDFDVGVNNLNEKITPSYHSFAVLATGSSGARVEVYEKALDEVQSLWQESETDDYIAAVQFPNPQNFSEMLSTTSEAKTDVSNKQPGKDQALFNEDKGDNTDQHNRDYDHANKFFSDVSTKHAVSHTSTSKSIVLLQKNTASRCEVLHDEKPINDSDMICEDDIDSPDTFAKYIRNNGDNAHEMNLASNTPKYWEGFMTGKGRRIKLSEEQIRKAKAKFETLDYGGGEDYHTILSSHHLQSINTASCSEIKLSEEKIKKMKTVVKKEHSHENGVEDVLNLSNEKFTETKLQKESLLLFRGLAAPSGANIDISNKQAVKNQALLDECIDNNTDKNKRNYAYMDKSINDVSTKHAISHSSTSENALFPNKFIVSGDVGKKNGTEDYMHHTTNTPKFFEGFITGKGRKIKASEEQIKKIKAKFEGLDQCEGEDYHVIPSFDFLHSSSMTSSSKSKVHKEQINKTKTVVKDECSHDDDVEDYAFKVPEQLPSISIASSLNIKPSKKQIKKTPDCKRGLVYGFEHYQEPCTVSEFKLAGLNSDKFDEDNKNRKWTGDDAEDISSDAKSPKFFEGFVTGRGRKVKASEEQIKKIKAKFEALDHSEGEEYPAIIPSDFLQSSSKASNSKLKGSNNQMKKTKTIVRKECSHGSDTEDYAFKVPENLHNMSTASMSDIKQIKKTKDCKEGFAYGLEPYQEFSSISGTESKLTGLFSDRNKNSTGDDIHFTDNTPKFFEGFITGKGRKIKASEEQVKKIKAKFEVLDHGEAEDYHSVTSSELLQNLGTTSSFQTASKEDVVQSFDLDSVVKDVTLAEFQSDGALSGSVPSSNSSKSVGLNIKHIEELVKKSQGIIALDNFTDANNIHNDEKSMNLMNCHSSPKVSEQVQQFSPGRSKVIKLSENKNHRNQALAANITKYKVDVQNTLGERFKSAVSDSRAFQCVSTFTDSKIKLDGKEANRSQTLIMETDKITNQSNDLSDNVPMSVDAIKTTCNGNVDCKFSHIRTPPLSLVADEFGREEEDEVKSLMRYHDDDYDDGGGDNERSVSPIIGSQSVTLKRKTLLSRKNQGLSVNQVSSFGEKGLEHNKTSGEETLLHSERMSTEGNVNDSYAQEIDVITEAFLRDDPWDPEESFDKKRKADEALDESNHFFQFKHPRQSYCKLSLEEITHAELKECIEKREMLRIHQQKSIQYKKHHSVIRPVQGCLHKNRYEKKHQRVNLRSLGMPKVFKDCNSKIRELTAGTAISFRFSVVSNQVSVDCGEGCHVIPGPDSCIGVNEIDQGFLAMPGVSPKLLPSGWVCNHYTWIVWKLAAMQRRLIPDNILTVENVVAQLKYRYDREIDRAERSIIRKITEGDDIPQKTMVLCIASIEGNGDELQKVSPQKNTHVSFMTLTDGWYSIKALVDGAFVQLYKKGKVQVGTKLVIHGAELMGNLSQCHPLDAPPSLSLRLHTNLTRRARWWCRLGLICQKGPLPIQLSAVHADGGLVGHVSVVISRVYPLMYFEKSDGKSVFRGEKAHLRLLKSSQHDKETTYLQIVADVEKEYEKPVSKKMFCKSSLTKEEIGNLKTGEDIAHLIENTVDPTNLEGLLTTSQIDRAQTWRQEQASERKREISAEVNRRLEEKQKNYEATPLLKLRIVDSDGGCAMLTVWRPPEELQQELSEGKRFNIQYIIASGYRKGCLQLTASRKTQWECIYKDSGAFPDISRHVTPLSCAIFRDFNPTWNEVDVVGVVFRISEMNKGLQMVYIVNNNIDVLCLKFWGGLKEFGVEETVFTESVICVSNGTWQGYSCGRFGCIHVTELTCVSSSPHSHHLVEAYAALKSSIKDMKALMYKADLKLDGRADELSLPPSDDQIICNVQSSSLVKVEKSNITEAAALPKVDDSSSMDKPLTPAAKRMAERSRDMRNRIRRLSCYGMPSPIGASGLSKHSPSVQKPFKCPLRKPRS